MHFVVNSFRLFGPSMFADPLSITVNGSGQSLIRVSSEPRKALYETADGKFKLTIQHTILSNGRTRSLFKLEELIVTTDPLVTAQNKQYRASTHIVVDRPADGFSVADLVDHIAGLAAFMTASTNAKATQFVQREA